MSENMSIDIIKSTQESLGKFVKKPPLSEKLLRKPPFRFLHDIVTAIIKTTGFFDELFTEEELDSENVKDREKKIAFLQKVIEVVNMVTNSSLSVRPSKIIAGQEPEKTNELLQQIGKALQQNLSSKEAVQSIKDKTGKAASSTKQLKNSENNKVSSKTNLSIKPEKSRKEATHSKIEKSPKEKSKTKVDTKDRKTISTKKDESTRKDKKGDSDSSSSKSKTLPTKRGNRSNDSRESEQTTTVDLQTEKIKIEADLPENENNIKSDTKPLDVESGDHTTQLITSYFSEKMLGPINDSNIDDTNIENDSNGVEDVVENVLPIEPIVNEQIQQQELVLIENKKDESDTESRQDISENSIAPSETLLNRISEKHSIKKTIANDANKTDSIDKIKEHTDDKTVRSGKRIERVSENLKKTNSAEKKSDDESIDQKLSRSSNDSESIKSSKSRNLLRPPSVRPSSARPGAPRLRERATDVIIKTAEPTTVGKVNVIIENYDNQQEPDEESLVVIQDTLDTNIVETNSFNTEEINSGHGHLVQQILDTQKKLVHDDNAKTEIEWEYGARRERETLYKEVDSIKVGLQSLSRAANPIGVLMDHVQEDVEVMRQELMLWRESYQSSATALSYQQSVTEQEVQVLLQKLKQLDVSILEQTDQIHTVKLSIHRNSERIKKQIDGEDNK